MHTLPLTVDESIQVLMIGCILIFITSYLAYIFGYFQLPKNTEPENKLPLKIVMSAFAIFLGFMIFLAPFLFVLAKFLLQGDTELTPKTLVLLNTSAVLGTFLALGIYAAFISSPNRKLIFGKLFGPTTSFKKTIEDISIGILTWTLSFPVLLVVGKMIEIVFALLGLEVNADQVAVAQVKESLSSPFLFLGIAASVVFFVPIIEEFLFRGCLQNWIKGKVGVKNAIILTSIVFASFHFALPQGLLNVELIISLFVLSCFLGFVYERQQSLLASISLHAFFNAVTVLVIAMS